LLFGSKSNILKIVCFSIGFSFEKSEIFQTRKSDPYAIIRFVLARFLLKDLIEMSMDIAAKGNEIGVNQRILLPSMAHRGVYKDFRQGRNQQEGSQFFRRHFETRKSSVTATSRQVQEAPFSEGKYVHFFH
jgi:hypothetical protein